MGVPQEHVVDSAGSENSTLALFGMASGKD